MNRAPGFPALTPFVLLGTLLGLLAIAPGHARAIECNQAHEIAGPILAVDAQARVFNAAGMIFQTDGQTRYYGIDGAPGGFSLLQEGQTAHVRFCPDSGGMANMRLVAIDVRLIDSTQPPQPQPVEFRGRISLLEPNGMVVDHHLVVFDPNTIFENQEGHPISQSELSVGECVWIRGLPLPSIPEWPAILAHVIRKSNECGDPTLAVVDGRVTEIFPDEQAFQINGFLKVRTTNETVYVRENGEPAGFGDLMLEMFVRVRGIPSAIPEEFEARMVILRTNEPEVVTLAGPIAAVDHVNTSLVVQGTQVLTNIETEITAAGGERLDFSHLQVNLFVEVVGVPMDVSTDASNSNFIPVIMAKRIHVPGEPGLIHLYGPIRELDQTTKQFSLIEFRVLTEATTVIQDRDGNAIEFDALAHGMMVEVIGVVTRLPVPNSAGAVELGEMVAHQIMVRNDSPPNHVVIGPILRVEPENMAVIVQNWMVHVNSQTLIVDLEGNHAPFSALREGLMIKAIGEVLPSAGMAEPALEHLQAHEIHILGAAPPPPPHVCGMITANDSAGGLVIDNQVVQATPNTQIVDEAGNPLTFADLEVGRHVCAEGEWNDAGALIARRIVVFPAPPPPAGDPVILHGVVESIVPEETAFFVSGRRILVTSETRIVDSGGAAVEFVDLAAGDRVAVAGFLMPDSPDGAIEARFVLVLGEPGQGITIEGRVNRVLPDQHVLVVNRIPLQVTEETVFEDGRARTEFGLLELRPGDMVRVQAHLMLDSPTTLNPENLRLVADSVTLLDRNDIPGEPVHLEGVIEALDPTSRTLVVLGQFVRTTNETDIRDVNGQSVGFETLEVDQFVVVMGHLLDDNSILAHVILIAPPPEPRPVDFRGHITRINPDEKRLVIAGRPVQVTPDTALVGPNGGLLSFSDLQVGMFVEVHGVIQPDTAFVLAFEIRLGDPVCPEVHLNGPISDFLLTTQDNLVGGLMVGQQTVLIGVNTRLLDSETSEPLHLSDLRIGDWVHVEGCLDGAGNIMARVVVRLGGEPGPECPRNAIYFGSIDSIDLENGVVDSQGILIVLSEETILLDSRHNPITPEQLPVGANFRTVGWLTASGVISACELRLLEAFAPPAEPDHIRGPIVSLDPNQMVFLVGETHVQVTPDTRIISRKGHPLSFGDLEEGQLVDVAGQRDATGVLIARLVKVQEENPGGGAGQVMVVRDFVTDIGTSGTLIVGATPVLITAETTILGFDGQPIDVAALNVGDFVRVRGHSDESGAVTALAIEVRLTVILGIDWATQTLVANGRTVQATDQTIIREYQGDHLAFSDLAIGDLVGIRAHMQSGELMADVIMRHATVSTGGLDLFDSTSGRITDLGEPAILSASNNTFGYVALPFEAFTGDPNTLYEVRVRVATNIDLGPAIPTLRLRTNLRNFAKGNCLVIDSNAGATFSPRRDGFDYSFVMTPPVEMESASLLDRQWFLSMDMLNFDPRFAKDAEFAMQAIDVRPLPMDQLSVARTFVHDRFVSGTNGWVFSGWPERFTLPASGTGASGSLDLAATDHNTFGFWFKDTGVTLEAGKTYRARFLVKTASTDPEKVPEFRLRINSSGFNIATVVNIASENGGPESPVDGARVYDAYLVMPGNATGDHRALVAFDLLSFNDTDDLNKAVSLEEFLFEELVLVP